MACPAQRGEKCRLLGGRAARAPPFGIFTVKTEKYSRGTVDLGARDARAPRKKGLAGTAEPVGVARPEAVGLEVLKLKDGNKQGQLGIF